MNTASQRTLYTIGHSTRTADSLLAMLRGAGVTRLVDIRRIPRSRTNPQFNAEVLPETLGRAGLAYTQLAALGGRRSKQQVLASLNTGWRVRAFQNYADYAASVTFSTGLDELLERAAQETCAIMCSEAVWWRCHRRIVADYVLARGVPVVHLLSETKREVAVLTPFASVREDGVITYPPVDSAGSG
jgi:uncharacterized protein (DUF488 family)